MDENTLNERQLRIVKRLQEKHNKPDPDSITFDKKERKSIKTSLIAIIGLVILMGTSNTYTLYNSSIDKHTLSQALTSKATEVATLTQQNNAYKKQLEAMEHKWRQTEDKRYQAQRQLNRKSEKLSQMQGSTKQAKAMVDKLQEMMQFTLDPKAVK